MPKLPLPLRQRLPFKGRYTLPLIGLMVIVGIVAVIFAFAAGPFSLVEPENGTLSSGAQLVNRSGASGGKTIKFGAPPAATPTPTATPTPPPAGRPTPFPAAMKPDATNTGVVAGTSLAIVNGDQTYTSASNGQTISGRDFRGFVRVTGANITFVNCVFRGRATSNNAALLDTEDSAGTIAVMDSEFVPSNPSATIDGIWTRNTNLYRVHVHGAVDGMKADSNTLVQDSYFHDMSWFASDPNQGGGPTHNDGIQTFDGESTVTLRHNNIVMNTTNNNAALQTSGDNTHVENNWLSGGGCTINADHLVGLYILNNRFGPSYFDCPILISTEMTITQNSGNVWDVTGQPIPAPQQHD